MLKGALLAAILPLLFAAPAAGQPKHPVPVKPAQPFTFHQVWAMNATYTSRKYGVTFRYPSVWNQETRFAYLPPMLTASKHFKPVTGFGYSEGGFPRTRAVGPYTRTNLEGFGIVYSAVPASSAANCYHKAASVIRHAPNPGLHPLKPVVLGGRTYHVYPTREAGMMKSLRGKLYATYAAHTCYLFETDVSVVQPGAVPHVKPLTHKQLDVISDHLFRIMQTVRIVPPSPEIRPGH